MRVEHSFRGIVVNHRLIGVFDRRGKAGHCKCQYFRPYDRQIYASDDNKMLPEAVIRELSSVAWLDQVYPVHRPSSKSRDFARVWYGNAVLVTQILGSKGLTSRS